MAPSPWVVGCEDLAMGAVAAASDFHARVLPALREGLAQGAAESLVILFAEADYTHDGWRGAVVASLAREAAPMRVNALAGGDAAARAAALAWLARAPGVTGQVLRLASDGASGGGLAKADAEG